MTDEDQVNDVTETSENNSLDSNENRGFSQDEVNRIVADRVARERKKFEGLDVDEYKTLKQAEEDRILEQQKQRGEFEKILKDQAEKFNSRIQELEGTLKKEKVDGALLNAASKNKSVAPNQVADLLKNRVRLNELGQSEVVDDNGTPLYKDDGSSFGVDDLVKDFLTKNPHFAAPSASGTGSESRVGGGKGSTELDITTLDMNNPKDRAKYAEWKAKRS
jgi:hypothetical protein